ncbi:SusC/RagA family TonB-linked outer membrane protein [Rufibacter quisquiliarum]|uniref:TonB-linked SusC/RagA family outer membrane protein n=1 Tax=Rufibacter quisquiliarum TaxID=1549639 RepID=A0A839GEJ8_9BACT|nr:TonB-dependent receptor [Rufibacter quisquiliarum]MBA9076880.1 TonB-linked SusC/RagA family outer membrane protein [Rufibacter quisquiliarum]
MKQLLLLKNTGSARRGGSLLLLALLGLAPFEGSASKREPSKVGLEVTSANEKQNGPVTGVVKDAAGQPLPGVSVSIKGTTIGAVTDIDGKFSINTSGVSQPVLVFTYIGFRNQEIAYTGQTSLNVALQEDTKLMDEVVVVGYGTQKKANLTGAVHQIEAEALEDRPITNVTSGMQGLMPGVTITGASGAPGNNGGSIRIRGIGTIGNATPLVVIDGIPGGTLDILNPNDIETISVLKDAASSSIYGVRGANGVILVTTKKGHSGKPSISYNTYYGIQTPTALPKFLGSPDYMTLLNEAQSNAGRNPTYSPEEIEIARNGSDPNYYANTNWIEEVYKDYAPQLSHNLNISGGADKTNYMLSYGYLKEGGLVVGDAFEANRHNVRAKISTTLVDRLEVAVNLGYVDRAYSGSAAGTGPLYSALSIRPLVPVRFTTGTWGYHGGQSNPIAIATDGGTNKFGSQEFTGNLSAILKIFEGLNVRGQYGIIRSNSKRDIFTKTIRYYSPDPSITAPIHTTGAPNSIDARDYTNMYQTFIGTVEYEKRVAEHHDFKVLLGASQEETISDNFTATRSNLAGHQTGHLNMGTKDQQNSGNASQNALRSAFGRLNYGFRDKYLAELNFRYDGSTRFAKDVRWELFSAASIGWVFTEESFFAGLQNVLNFGKVRFSYGTQGNDRITLPGGGVIDFGYMDILSTVATMPIGNDVTIGVRQTGVGNEFLTWESAIKQNVGIDLAFANNRLNITGDYFINETANILLVLPQPGPFGNIFPPQNAGKVENRGWEVQVGWKDKKGEFDYGFNFNISDVRNKITSLGSTLATYGDQVRLVGHPIDAFYGLVADRLAQESDFSYKPESGTFVADFPYIAGDKIAPGDIIYKDLNGDGLITLDGDRQVIGSAIPRYTFGFRGDVAFKGFDFRFFLQGVGDVDGYLSGNARHAFASESNMAQTVHLDRWTPDNPGASYPRLAYQLTHNQRLSTYWLEDASYLRLKNVQLGYTLPTTLTERVRISRLRVYASADNLFTETNYFYGFDPESPISNGNFYPQVKTFVFGVNINLK